VPVSRSTLLWSILLGVLAVALVWIIPWPGRVIFTEDTPERYVQVRRMWGSYTLIHGVDVPGRPDLTNMHEVHGDLTTICEVIHGFENPRIVVESKNTASYQVVYKWGDRGALKVIARHLGLVVAEEDRKINAFSLRLSHGGHRLKPAAPGEVFRLRNVICDVDGWWPLEGATMDDVTRFLETERHLPVVNLTRLEGRWSLRISRDTLNMLPLDGVPYEVDDTRLELRWVRHVLPVTVVKDAAE
jgi:hypothetical protein